MDLGKLRFIKEEDDEDEDQVLENGQEDEAMQDLAAKVEGIDVEDDDAVDEDEEEDEEWEEEEDDGSPAWLTEHTYVVRSTEQGAKPSDGEPLATVQFTTISRSDFREVGDDFHSAMDDISLEYSDFARAIFDSSLRFRPDLYSSGSKVFGKECDEGSVVAYLDEVSVHPDFRGKGLGKWTVKEMLASPELEGCHFVYVLPAILSEVPDDEEDEAPALSSDGPLRSPAETHALLQPLIAFFHALGFRRVGTTDYLCLPLSSRVPSLSSHPAVALPISQDPPSSSSLFALLPADEIPTAFPIHHLIRSSPLTAPGQQRLAASLRSTAQSAAFALDVPDPLGDTPLHVAAREGSSVAVTVLLALPGGKERREKRNVAGLTALDEAERAVRIVGPDAGRGAVLTLLRG